MTAIVIDTNVLLVAAGKSPQMSDACQIECVTRLERVKATEQVVLDDAWIILSEYRRNFDRNRSPTYGSAFLKWLHQVQAVAKHVSLVTITPLNSAKTLFAEFPADKELEQKFDPADRKFVAASNAHPDKPPILQSADSKWLGWEDQLKQHGIKVEVLCRDELKAIQKRKTKQKS